MWALATRHGWGGYREELGSGCATLPWLRDDQWVPGEGTPRSSKCQSLVTKDFKQNLDFRLLWKTRIFDHSRFAFTLDQGSAYSSLHAKSGPWLVFVWP